MNRIQTIERRIEKIKQSLTKIGDMRPGSLSIQSRSWGGEYCHLSYTHRGKGHTEYVRKKQQKVIERQIANYRKFRILTQEWVDLGIELCKLRAEGREGKKRKKPVLSSTLRRLFYATNPSSSIPPFDCATAKFACAGYTRLERRPFHGNAPTQRTY